MSRPAATDRAKPRGADKLQLALLDGVIHRRVGDKSGIVASAQRIMSMYGRPAGTAYQQHFA
jgi:hypothetical protein